MISPSERANNYRRAVDYLNRCSNFNESNLREANRIAGSPLLEEDVQRFLLTAPDILSDSSGPGGMEYVKRELRKTFGEGITVFESLEGAGIGRKSGCLGMLVLALAVGVLSLLLAVG